MSAYVVPSKQVALLINAAAMWNTHCGYVLYEGEKVTHQNGTRMGRDLFAQNIASVNYRYADKTTVYTEHKTFTHKIDLRPINPLALLKAISSYEYQACENPEWETSAAKDFCQMLRLTAITKIPGYEEAGEW